MINFWNSESSHMDEELKQIREDGFNSIILVVPWREFQPSMAPEHYNDYAWEKFDRVMKAANGCMKRRLLMTISAAVLLPGKISGILRKMAVPFMEAGSQDGKWQHSAAIPSM